MCVNKSTWGSSQYFVLESAFGHVPTVVELRKKGVSSATFTKKKIFWPKCTKAQEMLNEMQGKEVSTTRLSKYTSINCSNANYLYLVALENRQHASMILTNWSTMTRNGDTKKRRVGS